MTPLPKAPGRAEGAFSPTPRDEADHALILAFQSWPDVGSSPELSVGRQGAMDGPGVQRLSRLEDSWSERLRIASGAGSSPMTLPEPAAALATLRRMHLATIRVDLSRVHPSWCVRALREESPAVRRLVAAHTPEPLRSAIRSGLALDESDLVGERSVAPEILNWALVLWTERLVGGDPARTGDHPAIAVLTCLPLRSGYAICRLAGQMKCQIAGGQPDERGQSPLGGARTAWIQNILTGLDPQFLAQVSRDLQSKALAKVPVRHLAARLGVQTMARLLAECEPFRLRWALQHWPYPIAKLVRTLMPSGAQRSSSIAQGEYLILKSAWDRLNLEGSVARQWPIS